MSAALDDNGLVLDTVDPTHFAHVLALAKAKKRP